MHWLNREGRAARIGAPKEVFEGERRVAMTPQSAAALQKLGAVGGAQRPTSCAAGAAVMR